ncbi:MAG TPA: class F sortase [Actinomycetota bacterium]|jgi:sortase (surface protein transpeptidase)|nr:class F sortase [Actinomycetota bacterium]
MVLSKAMRLTRRAAHQLRGSEDFVPFVTAVFAIMLATLLIVIGTAQPTSLRVSKRIVAEPVQVKFSQPTQREAPATGGATSRPNEECPQMTNPGGLRWRSSPDAGPWATGGTVRLPKLGVSAPIMKVGIDMNGEMVVPRNAHQVAWLDQGQFPGDTNNGVLAGHIRWNKVTGSFGNIQKLGPGDSVIVELDGKQWEFRVTWMCLFDFDTPLAEKIMGYTNVPSVTLISCGGVYSWTNHTHNKRVAVRAELVRST